MPETGGAGPRVLFLGENWFGSCARACCYALRRLGCEVAEVDSQTFFPVARARSTRAVRRLGYPLFVREYNRAVLALARHFQPDLLLAFKAPLVEAATLREIRAGGAALYNFFPDTSAFMDGGVLAGALPEYDCLFYTKRFWDADVRARLAVRETVFVPHGYDPEVHRPWPPAADDARRYGHDVTLIATHMPHKEALLDALVAAVPEIDLSVWGNGWERCRSPRLRPFVRGTALNGVAYARAIRASRINLAIMGGRVKGASRGDETTTRTYEIPACGGFMLHERSDELLERFREGAEVACFGSADELAAAVRHYLDHPEERDRIASAGHARCVPAYAYDNRMAEILRWHHQRHGGPAAASGPAGAGP